MKVVYLSGKMTGLAESEYKENFRNAEMFYRACGYDVINPCHISAEVLKKKPNAVYEDFMKEDLKALAGCTHIAMLEGWETSCGAKRELMEARKNGIAVIYFKIKGDEE